MPLIKPNRELDRLLEAYPLQIIAFGMNDAWFVMPMPRQLLKENHDVYVESSITESDRDHWALKDRKPVSVPVHVESEQRYNAIDDFVAARLRRNGLRIQSEASRQILLKRVTLDLTGLLPTVAETNAFVADQSAHAFNDVVDRLLKTSAYGERWAQHWLDLARFAETDGFEHDNVRSEAWKYRDWVIAAFNEDMPFDRFARLQIAGDILEADVPGSSIATQFCVSGQDMPDINSQEERRHSLLNEMTSTVGEVFLGLQIGCAQCHDHKYDAVSQADFYRMRAIFEPGVRLKKNASVTALREDVANSHASHLMIRGDYRRPGAEVLPGVLRVLESETLQFQSPKTGSVTRPRAAFANWLVDPDHPLTPRVFVNRIWQQQFGVGLCETSSDFGVMGQEPVNRELLDWLANWFVEHDWSIKELHRLIVRSATYRQNGFLNRSATGTEVAEWQRALQVDPDARLLSRFPRQRLSGEVIRDILLQAAGVLNRKSGGPGIRPPLPEELRGTLLKGQWEVSADPSEHYRRSIYVFARRNLRFPIFEAFDRPSANESCSRRNISTTAPQALHLLNSEFTLEMAKLMAKQVRSEWSIPDEQITAAFASAMARHPSADEVADVRRFLNRTAGDELSGLTNLCLSLFNSNEFVFVD
jgi:hypothetical protein